MSIDLREATPADWPAIESLLLANHLPTAGFRDAVSSAVVAYRDTEVVGVAGLEVYGDTALLRSVAVDSRVRGQGLGQALTRHALATARAHNVADVFLLTTTAEAFFPRLGFEPIERADVPASVQQSVEFKGACPASAVAMRRRVRGSGTGDRGSGIGDQGLGIEERGTRNGERGTVIFACVHNAGRSQMAAAFFNLLAPAGAQAISAGTNPGPHVHPEVVDAMREVGIDLSSAVPQRLTPDLAAGSTMLITMGCGDQCPVLPGVIRDDWPLEDPKGKPIDEVRRIRDDIKARVAELVRRLGDQGSGIADQGLGLR